MHLRDWVVHDLECCQMSREHNNSNILVLGGRTTDGPLAENILNVWLETPFSGGRHQRRLDKITQVEQELGTRIKDGNDR